MTVKMVICISSIALALVGCSASQDTGPQLEKDPFGLNELLVGCWQNSDGFREVWNTPRAYDSGDSWIVFGHATHVKPEGELTFTEQMRLQIEEGQAKLYVSVSGQSAEAFHDLDLDDGQWVFERDGYDHPQMISYGRVGDILTASIAMKDGTKSDTWELKPCS